MDKSEIEEQGWKVPDSALTENENSGWEESNARDLYNERQETDALSSI